MDTTSPDPTNCGTREGPSPPSFRGRNVDIDCVTAGGAGTHEVPTRPPKRGRNDDMDKSREGVGSEPPPPRILIFRGTGVSLGSLNPFQRKNGCDRFGTIIRCDRLRDSSLEVEFAKGADAAKALQAKEFVYKGKEGLRKVPMDVEKHRTKNSAKGLINCFDLKGVSDADIADGLEDFVVIEAKRTVRNQRSENPTPTHNIILTFNSVDLPKEVKVGYVRVRVRPFVPNPMRCFHCQKFGHTTINCSGKLTCGRCASSGHSTEKCTSDSTRCANCRPDQKPHMASDRGCPEYLREKGILTLKVTKSLTFREARDEYNASHPRKSFADVVRGGCQDVHQGSASASLSSMNVGDFLKLLSSFGLCITQASASTSAKQPAGRSIPPTSQPDRAAVREASSSEPSASTPAGDQFSVAPIPQTQPVVPVPPATAAPCRAADESGASVTEDLPSDAERASVQERMEAAKRAAAARRAEMAQRAEAARQADEARRAQEEKKQAGRTAKRPKTSPQENVTKTRPRSTSREEKVTGLSPKMKEAIMSSSAMIVVSNRLPFILSRNEDGKLQRKQCAGGLVTAVAPVVVESGGLWVGWPGIHLDEPLTEIPESQPEDKSPTAGLKSKQVLAVSMDRKVFNAYYNGCCNGTFWPLFHSMPDRAIFKADHWEEYKKANQLFAVRTIEALERMYAERANELIDNPPLVWIHDYHLMLAANTIRLMAEERNLKCKLGFFLHIPCPSWDIMRLFPWDDEILQGMLGCDMVGFHIDDYCFNFIDCCQRRLGCRVDRNNMLVEHGGRTVRVRALPIGIPYERFRTLAKTAPVNIRDGQQIILGVDRLDYTKGLVNRIRAFERLLELHPEYIEKVTFLQVAVPSRTDVKEYQELKEEIDQLVGQVNGRFTTPMWSPIRYIYGCISHDQLAGFYRDAAVALVTPLRDGMNLVAKEFVACQNEDRPGVLILSPFAGSGAQMMEALLVNPYEIDDVAETIHRGLTMELDERRLRMTCLKKREKERDVTFWLRSFLKEMGTLRLEDGDSVRPTQLMPVSMQDFDEFLRDYISPHDKVSLLLDYDGTLAPIAPHPDLATIPDETKRVLERLSNVSDIHIAIISGRSLENIREMVGIANITYAGNHGLEILHPDGTKFVHPVPGEYEIQLSGLLQALQDRCCREGAWVENKGVILTFHYREVPMERRQSLVTEAKQLFHKFGFQPSHARCAIEARPPVKWNKGRASIYILRTLYGLDWHDRVKVLFAGDDVTDEDAMIALQGIAVSFRVTTSCTVRTAANRRLPDTDSVLMLLRWVERRMASQEPTRKATPPRLSASPPRETKLHCQMSIDEAEIQSRLHQGLLRTRANSNSVEGPLPNGA